MASAIWAATPPRPIPASNASAPGGGRNAADTVSAPVLRVAAGAIALGIVLLHLALGGGDPVGDSLLVLGAAAPLGLSLSAARGWSPGGLAAVAAMGIACLVLAIAASGGATAWPALVWLAIAPCLAWRSGGRDAGMPAALISVVAAIVFMAILPGSPEHGAAGQIAWLLLPLGFVAEYLARRPVPIAVSAETDRQRSLLVDETLVAALGDVVTWHDRSGDVLRAVGATEDLFGCPAGDLAGGGFLVRIHLPDRPAVLHAISQAVAAAVPSTLSVSVLAPRTDAGDTLEPRPTEMRIMPARRLSGGIMAVALVRDSAERMRDRAELEAARLEAERASDMKGRFLATVSHELRTPLNAIIGFSELLSADHPFVMAEDRRREYAGIIRDSGHHLLDVVNTLLDISKIESGNFAFQPEPFSLADLARGCCDLMGLKAEQAGLVLRADVERDLPDIVGDRRACRQILINLLSNAVKFTPAPGRVTVSLRRQGALVAMAVSDTGIGIRAADGSRIGDAFFQAGDLHGRPHEGTGLGLSVVRGLVGLHGGEIDVESGPGAGTAVTIRLPLDASGRTGDDRSVPVRFVPRHPVLPQPERKIA